MAGVAFGTGLLAGGLIVYAFCHFLYRAKLAHSVEVIVFKHNQSNSEKLRKIQDLEISIKDSELKVADLNSRLAPFENHARGTRGRFVKKDA